MYEAGCDGGKLLVCAHEHGRTLDGSHARLGMRFVDEDDEEDNDDAALSDQY